MLRQGLAVVEINLSKPNFPEQTRDDGADLHADADGGGEGAEPAHAAPGHPPPRVARPVPGGLPGAAQLPLPLGAGGVLQEGHARLGARPKG